MLRACLKNLAPSEQSYQRYLYEIIVSDDGRNPLARDAIGEEFPEVRWVDGPCRGPAANRNAGAAQAQGEVLVFLDDDCLPQRELLASYAEAFTDPELTAAEGRIRADRPRRRMDEEAPVNEFGGCFWSCNIAIRRNLFRDIGGFDERFPKAAMEDVELRERIKRVSNPIRFIPEALVIHPLRPLKGWRGYRERAEGHGIYILIPGCHLPPPSYRSALWDTLRKIKRRYLPDFISLRGRGALKASLILTVPIMSAWHMKKALREAKKTV